MSLTAGTRLGPYEIGVLLGQGGMGEVYRARDTRLGRDVAIKVSVERFNERFEREARAVAALNHPNICTLHDVGPNYLVMELVDGETLAEKLEEVSRLKSQGSGLPLDEALTIARQIAEAIEAAHEKAIVHRDLKPANVKITPDGLVKVLDFGLARIGAGAAGGDPATSPTLSMATGAGVILGTAAYMSPEQARGLPADHRSDVFSFGIVLCEMLTGRRPFPGETAPDVLASVLARDPDLSALPPNLNPRIGELLRRCLDKNPKRRWQAAGDLRAEIETIAAAPRAVPPSAAVVTPRPFWKRAMPVAATAVLATALMSVVWWSFRPGTPLALAVTRFSFLLPAGQQFTSIASRLVAISPDGKEFVYVANGLVYLRSMSELEASPIPGTESLQSSYPTFSPDGRSVAFHSNRDRTLKRIAVSGGAAVTIGEDVDLPYGMSWGANGILVGQTGKGIIRVLPNGGKPELLVSIKPGEIAHGPQILPGGEAVLFTLSAAAGSEQWDNALIVVQSLASGARTTLIEGGSDARYLPTGHIVYALGGSLFAIPFDLERLQVTGGSTPVVAGVRRTARSGTAIFSVSDTGTLIYLRGPAFTSSSQRDLVLIDRKGDIEPLKVPRGAYESPRVSPDGKRVAVSTDTGREANIWIYELDGASPMRRLTFGGRNRFPVWSADGQWVAFQSDREGDLGIFWQRADGSGGTAERLTKPDQETSHIPESWSRTGQVFSFSVTTATDASLWMFSIRDKRASRYGEIQAFNSLNSVFSPDGRWVAYTLRWLGGTAVFVQPFPTPDARFQISKDDDLGHHPLWSPDGKQIFYFQGANALVAANVTTAPRFTFGNPAPIPGEFVSNVSTTSPRNHDITPDGTRIVMVLDASAPTQSGSAMAPQFDIVLNWFEELKARVPTK